MNFFVGLVSGIDVQASPGLSVRCQAFVTQTSENRTEIQVTTGFHALQTALELASSMKVQVEVTYVEVGPEKMLTRVQLRDR